MLAKTTIPNDVGLRLIVSYKLVKAALEIVFGVALLLFADKATDEVRHIALHVRNHGTAAWSMALADKVVLAATSRHLLVGAVASLLDGVFTSIEAWALHRRYRWSGWLVIGATSCLLPFEALALLRRVTAGRILLLIVNATIVIYLVRRESAIHRASSNPSGHAGVPRVRDGRK